MAILPLTNLAISLPFKIDAVGKVGATVDQAKIWSDKVRSVIGTALGQRVYRSDFGCNATMGVFDTEEYVLNSIEEDIAKAFTSFLPLLQLDNVVASLDLATQSIVVEVTYSTPSGSDFIVRLGIASINQNGLVSEEFAWQTQ
jgi:phage baseplate assembly protein W